MSRFSTAGAPRKSRITRTLAVVTGTLLVASTVGLIAAGADTPAPARPPKPACTTTGCVRLHLGTDGSKFTYNGVTQNLSVASTCKLNAPGAGSIMTYSATSTSAGATPGMNGDGIGVRVNSSGNGTPCGQVDHTETLTVSPFKGTGAVIPNAKFTGLTMDLEMTGNAKVRLDLNTSPPQTYYLETGTSIDPAEKLEPGYVTAVPYLVTSYSNYVVNGTVYSDMTDACAQPSSSGPNNGPNDNCEWTVLPNSAFTQATLSVVNGVGTVSLKGSGDFGNDPTYDTQFYVDTPPTANPDSYGVLQSFPPTPLQVAAPGVLGNDTDLGGAPPIAAVPETVTTSKGSVTLAADGSFVYTPNAGATGTDTFTYQAVDSAGVLSTPATVTITIDAAPVANNDGPYLANQGGQVVTVDASKGLLANDTEPESQSISVNSYTQPDRGTVSVNPDGSFAYTSDPAFDSPTSYGTSFTYTAKDSAGAVSPPATVDLTVLPVMCTGDTKTTFSVDGLLSGAFTLLSPGTCKGFQLSALDPTGLDANAVVTFLPNGNGTANFRGNINVGPFTPISGQAVGTLHYNLDGGPDRFPVPWCQNSQFDANGDVTSATIPQVNVGITDKWCIAKMTELQSTDANGNAVVTPTWQVFGQDDPNGYR